MSNTSVQSFNLLYMKKIMIVITLISGIACHVHGQWNTTYGVNTAASSWGSYNSHFGFGSGYFSYSGTNNTGIGYNALINGGTENTAVGADAMRSGHGGTAVGYQAMKHNCDIDRLNQTHKAITIRLSVQRHFSRIQLVRT